MDVGRFRQPRQLADADFLMRLAESTGRSDLVEDKGLVVSVGLAGGHHSLLRPSLSLLAKGGALASRV
jgi:hypothetical protein